MQNWRDLLKAPKWKLMLEEMYQNNYQTEKTLNVNKDSVF
jgi:hypothetical protein